MYFLNVFPLEEQYINNAKADEIIIDPKTGHITICKTEGSVYVSNSKDIEADLNGLLSLKDKFYKEYLQISDELEDAVNKLMNCRENIRTINGTISECQAKLIKINQLSSNLMKLYNDQYEQYNDYLFNQMNNFRTIIRDNTKKVIAITILLEELELLSNDINSINVMNENTIKTIKSTIGM